MTRQETTVNQLDELLAAIRGYDDPRRAANEWKQVYRLLQETDLPPGGVTATVGMRDVARLAELIDQLRKPEAAAAPQADAPDAETCRQAFKAFRKRLALTRLDDESRISNHSPLSKGEGSSITAMTPPTEWPQAVWGELVRQGRLRCIGHGLYELTNP